jgi:DHA1 family multidrug resistance protein-like MFS transporter
MSRDLIFLATALGTWGLGESMSLYFQSLYLAKLGADPVRIGFILGAVSIAMTSAHIPAGYLADRIGRRPLIWVSWIMGATAGVIMGLARSLDTFTVGLLIYGVTMFVNAPMNSYITAARGNLSPGRALTLVSACYSVGATIGPLLGGAIADRSGNLRLTYQIGAGLFIISTLIVLCIRAQPREAPHPAQNIRGLLADSPYRGFLGIVFLATFATYLAQPLSNNFLQQVHGLTFSQIGRLGSITALGVVILNLGLGHLEARRGFILAQACIGAFTLLVWRGAGLPWFAVGYFLLGGFRTLRALAAAQARELVQPGRMGLAYGLLETVSALALVLASPLAGYLFKLNPSLMYTISLGLILISILAGLQRVQRGALNIQKEAP